MHDHGIDVVCTWPDLEGGWEANPGTSPGTSISVTHSAGDIEGEYATCSGWDIGAAIRDAAGNVIHGAAPYEQGQFKFNVTYSSTKTTTCIEDPNSGIGNNCVKFTDANNKKHGGGDSAPTSGATFACKDNFPGTTLTYQFYCADGVGVSGYLTLVPTIGGSPQAAPKFTGPCSPARVAAGACTVQMGGIPETTIKVKGQEQLVVDTQKCLEAFPQAAVSNALGTTQTQNLEAGAILFYQETAYTGSCAALDTGSPTAAYGRYCQSDIDTFADNLPGNIYDGDELVTNDGFDNELRVCEQSDNPPPHTADQDVETIELSNITFDSQPTLNLNCWTGNGGNDSGIYKVWISDQSQLLAGNIVVDPLSDAPTLEGVSPNKASISVDEFGVNTLELAYPTCYTLSENVISNNAGISNNSNVFLTLEGYAKIEGGLDQKINEALEVKVNGL